MFPLIVNLNDDTLRVSEACPHVVKEEALMNPKIYFRDEYPIAIRNYVMLKIIDSFAKTNKWVLTLNPNLSSGDKAIDLDEYIDTSDLEAKVLEFLTEVSEE